ncbi:NAD-dependent deacetylase sirtuin-2, putative [Perkinsus marinus ATCC 50983]|uniref:NAD-dependent deacetylase sirtuin-2, putative n=1 Tax=Perkinsus marinus (strain ATCC 50983 / TXsc) TaxID=423536 RepID=C5LNA1_PERM5|nr:NAD-dependent deacetylase sirtuin-2, putative [Perkinsus marinus ATCC 50983]EER01780.1 NAD-dependent deacetylase sirtuin-2, putative [Perkinsus marinus ATCC 50983]|eukprot:XP_002769062.1 NAD-dependent deacetylase sirtuin-2, putative [Perkinsus marinus ATCC 50983]
MSSSPMSQDSAHFSDAESEAESESIVFSTASESSPTSLPQRLKDVFGDNEVSLEALCADPSRYWKRVVVLAGAGISVSAGIPDFRSPNTGIYANVKQYTNSLRAPEDLFSIHYFRHDPYPFYTLCHEAQLGRGAHEPTAAHRFIAWLAEKGALLRCYTQNIDSLEIDAGVPEELVVQAHGHLRSARCIDCGCPYGGDMRDLLSSEKPVHCAACYGLVKPDVVFFGENLPERFFDCVQEDLSQATLLVVMGTSLQVGPCNQIPILLPRTTPRLLVNLTPPPHGMFRFGRADNYRDVFVEKDTDSASEELRKKLEKAGGLTPSRL